MKEKIQRLFGLLAALVCFYFAAHAIFVRAPSYIYCLISGDPARATVVRAHKDLGLDDSGAVLYASGWDVTLEGPNNLFADYHSAPEVTDGQQIPVKICDLDMYPLGLDYALGVIEKTAHYVLLTLLGVLLLIGVFRVTPGKYDISYYFLRTLIPAAVIAIVIETYFRFSYEHWVSILVWMAPLGSLRILTEIQTNLSSRARFPSRPLTSTIGRKRDS